MNYMYFLSLFSQDFDFLPHRANIVSMVMSRGQPSAAGPVYDTKLQCCYHMVLLEPRVTMVGVCVCVCVCASVVQQVQLS